MKAKKVLRWRRRLAAHGRMYRQKQKGPKKQSFRLFLLHIFFLPLRLFFLLISHSVYIVRGYLLSANPSGSEFRLPFAYISRSEDGTGKKFKTVNSDQVCSRDNMTSYFSRSGRVSLISQLFSSTSPQFQAKKSLSMLISCQPKRGLSRSDYEPFRIFNSRHIFQQQCEIANKGSGALSCDSL